MSVFRNLGLLSAAIVTAALISGCAGEKPVANNETSPSSTSTASHDDHSGWWCVEHAIPEEECSMCSASAKEACKAKGDWCEEHTRAESQCFICDPSRAEKFAKLYEAKFGEKPPAATE
jgi:hypothetical protein